MNRILVTGGTGFIGSHTVVELIKAGYEIDILDNLYNSKYAALDKITQLTGHRPTFFMADLCDAAALERIFAKNHYDLVVHFAGLKAVAESVAEPLKYYDNNVVGTINLLKCMQKYGVKRIVFSSSATVYGQQPTARNQESMVTGVNLTNPYGETKHVIEEILKDVVDSDPEFSATILRYFNPVGNHPSGLLGEDPNDIPNNLMPIIMKVASGELSELKVYGADYPTRDGSGIRDYIHVVDLARGHVSAIFHMRPGVNIYNLGTGKGTSVFEMIAAFEQASGRKLPVKVVERRPGDLPEIYADPSKAEQELNWRANLTIADAMRDTLTYLNNRPKPLLAMLGRYTLNLNSTTSPSRMM